MHESIEPQAEEANKIEILLVDDREDGLITLEALLHDQKDYILVKARSGREALRSLEGHDFAMILLDVQMPELDGFETAELIRSKSQYSGIPIIFVTAINKDERYVYRGYEAGAVDYIFKPFDPAILKSKVAVFADLYRKNRDLRRAAVRLSEKEVLEHKAFVQSIEISNLRRYKNLGDAIPHIVLRAVNPAELEYSNELWSSYTGLPSAEVLGTSWQKAVDMRDLQDVLKGWQRGGQLRQGFQYECRLIRHDGASRWHWLKAVPEKDDKGKVTNWLITFTDIHDRKATEQNLKEAQKRAEAANDAKTHFLANMSHEIRTPLNAIMGFTELLLDPAISMDEKVKSVGIVRRNGQQLLKIVDEILDISKVEAGGLEMERVETNVQEMLFEIKSLMENQASAKGIELIFENISRLPNAVMTDSTRLRQILLNVIGNAIKFTEKGSVRVSGRYFTSMEGQSILQFCVTDTGLGVDEDAAEKIFQPFSQADSSTTRLYGGTGLGLALSRRLARALGGDVKLLRSRLGHGSTFEIEVKADLAGQANAKPKMSAIHEEASKSEDISMGSLKGKKILLVEDAEDNQFLIRQFLHQTGAVIDVANNGKEGVEKALKNDYEIVLMDIQMPLVDGYQATTQLRQAGYAKPIIALTAHALVEEREKSLSNGCNGHLTKPVNRRQLIESIQKFVSHH